MREELCKAKLELSQLKEELIHSNLQKEKITSQVMHFLKCCLVVLIVAYSHLPALI